MRKYRIYSGTKPSSADKAYAVSWGGKYFAVSPTSEKQVIPSITLSNVSVSGSTLSVTCSNNGDDTIKLQPHKWCYSNENINSGNGREYYFDDDTTRTFGPKTSMVYSWNDPSILNPGTNIITAFFWSLPAFSYQTGTVSVTTNKLVIYKRYAAPKIEIIGATFENKSYGSSNRWGYSLYYFMADRVDFSIKITNPNAVSAAEYEGTTKKEILVANGSTTVTGPTMVSHILNIDDASSSLGFAGSQYFLDSSVNATNVNTKSESVQASIPNPPVLVGCMPTSASSSSFQVTVKNTNSSQYYCRVQYNCSGSTGSDFWLARCPANGTGTMMNTSGSTATFTLNRGEIYVLTLYFYTLTGTSLAYSGTQVSRTVHYPYKTPDAGFFYASPILVEEIYDDYSAPSEVTFKILNVNNVALKAEMDLYIGNVGNSTSGTRVDYWTVTVPPMSSATCPNSWNISQGSTYTLNCYFMNASSSYHGTAVSGFIAEVFTTPSES